MQRTPCRSGIRNQVKNSVLTWFPCSFPDRSLTGAAENDGEPDGVGVGWPSLDTRQGERSNDFFRYVFHVRCRKMTLWIGVRKCIQIQTVSRSQIGDSISPITLFANYRIMSVIVRSLRPVRATLSSFEDGSVK